MRTWTATLWSGPDTWGLLRTWMDYLGCWDRFLYGTDWPIVNLAEYRDYVTRIVPEERRPAVFFDNANRVYGLGL